MLADCPLRQITTVAPVSDPAPSSALRVAERPEIRVVPLRLACCAVEIDAAQAAGLLIPEGEGHGAPVAAVVVVAGTVTEPMAAVVEAAAGRQDAPTSVLAFGACASTGGPYWDAPSVVNGADSRVTVAEYVPGCPPRPDDLVRALLEVVAT